MMSGTALRRSRLLDAIVSGQVVLQPPYAAELNPVELLFRELRRALEGRVHPTLQAKQEAPGPS